MFPLTWAVDHEDANDQDVHDWRCSCGKDCHSPAKHPLTTNGLIDGTTDVQRIRGWWGKWPEANIGVATGRHPGATTGIAVVDYDPRHDPDGGTLDFLRSLPPTRGVRTGGGGDHLYYKIDAEQRSRAGLKPGLDIRGDGGYVVAPPSIHISGKEYEWDLLTKDLPMVMLPDAVKDIKPKPMIESGESSTGTLIEGSRNSTLTSLAGTARKRGAEREVLQAYLLAENLARCNPPLPEAEVLGIVENVLKYPPHPEASAPVEPRPLMSYASPEFLALDIPEPKFLIDRIWPEEALGFLIGPSGSFKSFAALEMGFSIATGKAFLGRYAVPAPRTVLYFQAESSRGAFRKRLERARTRFGDAPNLYVVSNEPLLLEDQVAIDRIRFELKNIRPSLVIFDPLRSYTASDEDKSVTMGPLVRTLRLLRDEFKTAIVVVHHTIKSGTGTSFRELSGSGALVGAKDAAILMHRVGDEPRSTVKFYLKDGDSLPDKQFQFNPSDTSLSEIDVVQLAREAATKAVADTFGMHPEEPEAFWNSD